MKSTIIRDMTNADYHGGQSAFSSSQIKTVLEDIELFYRKHILKELKDESIPAFDIGTYYHTAILEPDKLADECIVWTGARRAGKEWEQFKLDHTNKAIITQSELAQAINLIEATKRNTVAMELLSRGEAEVSFYGQLLGLPIKGRTDWIYLGKDESYIIDLKSTTGNAKDVFKTKGKIESYGYDLSASLYLDLVNSVLKEKKIDCAPVTNFYWVFASKDICNSAVFAASNEMLRVGRRKYEFCLNQIKKYQALDWKFIDELQILDPVAWVAQEWKDEEKTSVQRTMTKNNPKVVATTTRIIDEV
jgi:hypothetical protein